MRACPPALCLLFLFIMAPIASAQPLDIDLADVRWWYGPETWKDGRLADVDDQESLAVQAADWSTSLGAVANLTVTVSRGGVAPAADWSYVAQLSDGRTSIRGTVDEETPGRLLLRFDVDGQRAVPGWGAVPALAPGSWQLRIDASSPNGLGSTPQGWGTRTLATEAVRFAGVDAPDAVLGVPVPEEVVPGFRDITAGPNAWMPATPLDPMDDITVWAEASPGSLVRWMAWVPDTAPATPDLSTGTPFSPYGLRLDHVGLGWTAVQGLPASIADSDGRAALRIPGGSIPDSTGIDTGLWAFAAVGDRGAHAFLFAFAPSAPEFTAVEAGEPGAAGPVQFTVSTPASAGPLLAGPVALLVVDRESDPTRDARGRAVATGLMVPAGSDTWRGGFDGGVTRNEGAAGSAVLAFFQAMPDACAGAVCPATGDGAIGSPYRGHATLHRGVDVHLDVPVLGVGREAEIRSDLVNPGPLDVRAHLRFLVDDDMMAQGDVIVPAGATVQRLWTHTPATAGATGIALEVDTGDLLWQERETVTVLTGSAYDAENAPWYSPEKATPVPLGLAVVALALAIVLRRSQA